MNRINFAVLLLTCLFSSALRADPISNLPQETVYVLDEDSTLADIGEFDVALFILAGEIHVTQLNESLSSLEANLEIVANSDVLHLSGFINLQPGALSSISCQSQVTGTGTFNVSFNDPNTNNQLNISPASFSMSAIGAFTGGASNIFGVHINAQPQEAVPEPMSVALLGLGLLPLLRRRREAK